MHVHISSNAGEEKFWLEPEILLAVNHGLTSREIRELQRVIEEHRDEITQHWYDHFGAS